MTIVIVGSESNTTIGGGSGSAYYRSGTRAGLIGVPIRNHH